MTRYLTVLLTVVVAVAWVSGCGRGGPPTGTVSGKLTLDGEPVRIGVLYLSCDAVGAGAIADLDQQGQYSVTQPIPCGEYQVMIRPSRPPDPDAVEEPGYEPPEIPPEYEKVYSTEGLTVTIEPGANQHDFDL